jgi:tungstate transport system permease protein
VLVNSLLGLPPVVVGLLVYLLLSRAGPLGDLGLLFTPAAMVIAQAVLVTPIVVALTAGAVEALAEEYGDQLRSLGAGPWRALPTLLLEGRAQISVAVLAGLGRALGEVGAVILVGGNIAHATRVMTTAIALETSRGALALALALGLLLIGVSILLNGSAYALRQATLRHA